MALYITECFSVYSSRTVMVKFEYSRFRGSQQGGHPCESLLQTTQPRKVVDEALYRWLADISQLLVLALVADFN